jgi:3',5'-cyclic AMP phosphodiesterase CpdA
MFSLAQLSDIHLAPLPRPALHELISKRALGYINWRRRRGHHRRDVLDRVVEDLLAQAPDHIAVTGDLVNIALPEEFRAARRWLDSLGGPETTTVIPGNHDAYVPFLRNPWNANWQPYMTANEGGIVFANGHKQAFPFVRLFGEIALICLSSARATMPAMASGRLGRRQIARMAEILAQLGQEGYCRIVLIHHPVMPATTPWVRALHDARAFRKVVAEQGAELVLHGHNHRAMMARLEGRSAPIPIIGVPSASLASDEPSKSASYNLFGISKGGNGNWRISMRSRIFNPDGDFIENHQDLLP